MIIRTLTISHFLWIILLICPANAQIDYLLPTTQSINSNSYYRITKSLTQNELSLDVFGSQHSSEWVRIAKLNGNGSEDYGFSISITSDPEWNRLVFSDYDKWLDSYGDKAGHVQLDQPKGIARARWAVISTSFSSTSYGVPIYVVDSKNNRVVEFTLVMTHDNWGNDLISFSYRREFTGFNSPTDVAYQSHPSSIQPDNGYLWVTDTGNHKIVRIDLTAGAARNYGGMGNGNNKFYIPTYIASAKNGDGSSEDIYVVDAGNTRLVKFKPLNTVSGGGASSPGSNYDMQWLKEAKFTNNAFYKGIYDDPFGGLWAVDENYHSLTRFDEDLNLLFAHGTFGEGQTANKLNKPNDAFRFFRNIIDNGSNQSIQLTDLSQVTEAWGAGSGQLKFQSIPKLIDGSFSFEHVYEGGGGGGPLIPQPPSDWFGTSFSFKNSDACFITAAIYDYQNNQLVKSISNNQFKLAGDVNLSWGGDYSDGEKYDRCNYYIRITFSSNYGYPNNYTRTFNINIPDCGGSLVKTDLEDSQQSITTFEAFPAYPNPFNSTTKLRFSIPRKGKLEVIIYNVLGQKVKSIANSILETGNYTLSWNGKNDSAQSVGSGVYFVRSVFEGDGIRKQHYNKLLLVE